MFYECLLMLTLNCFSIALSPFLSAGGSYKKIGYYDMTKGNLSWYGNDRWIGEYTFVSLISHICSCLSLSEALFSVLNLLSHNHSHYYSHHSSASLQVSQPHILGPAPKTKRTVDDRLLRDINQSVSQILFSILSVRAAALRKLCMALQKKKKRQMNAIRKPPGVNSNHKLSKRTDKNCVQYRMSDGFI